MTLGVKVTSKQTGDTAAAGSDLTKIFARESKNYYAGKDYDLNVIA